jgi:hypothetical protein
VILHDVLERNANNEVTCLLPPLLLLLLLLLLLHSLPRRLLWCFRSNLPYSHFTLPEPPPPTYGRFTQGPWSLNGHFFSCARTSLMT